MTRELSMCKNVIEKLGRTKAEQLLEDSSLNDREKQLLELRLIRGVSLKECSVIFVVEEDSINKAQLKASKKLFTWLKFNNYF